MSTKNLSRTAIEGGRSNYNKWDRRYSHAETRAKEKAYISEVMDDMENWYDYDVEPTRPVGKDFSDKLGPMYRWLERQVGRLWDEVRSDVTKDFDTRTTAGRHIVYDHLLHAVSVTPEVRRYYSSPPDDPTTSFSKHDFYVDDEGILRQKTYLGRRYREERVPEFDTRQIANWLNGRIIGKVGNKFFWFVPTGKSKKYGGYSHIWKTVWERPKGYYYFYGPAAPQFYYLSYETIYKADSLGNLVFVDGNKVEIDRIKKWVPGSPHSLRQDRKLTPQELEYWNKLPTYYQTRILEKSPNYPKPAKPTYGYSGYY